MFHYYLCQYSPEYHAGGTGFKAVAYSDFTAKSYLPKYWYVDHDYMMHFKV